MNELEIRKKFIEWRKKPRARVSWKGVGVSEEFNFKITLTNDPTEEKKKIDCKICTSWLADDYELAKSAINMISLEFNIEIPDRNKLKECIDINSDIYVFAYLEKPKRLYR
jgi:hypothetical protein